MIPPTPFHRLIRLPGLLLAMLVLLLGCSSVKLAYNNLDEVVYWWLDGYVDFETAQNQRVREDLDSLHGWHRASELPRVEALLAQFEQLAVADITADKACGFAPVLRQAIGTVADRAEPALVSLALSLTPDQLRHLEDKYSRNNVKFEREWVHITPGELLDKRFKAAVQRSERVYGRLADAQRAVLRQQLSETAFEPRRSLAQRQRRQQETLVMLARLGQQPGSMTEARAQVRATLDRMLAPPPEQAAYTEALIHENCRVLAATLNSTTPAQREVAVQRLRGWQRDLQELSQAR